MRLIAVLVGYSFALATASCGGPRLGSPTNQALQVPAPIQSACPAGGPTRCFASVPPHLRSRTVHLPVVKAGAACPSSSGTVLELPNASGVALGQGPVRVMVVQAGDLTRGIVRLGASDVSGWYGIKTHWTVSPSYTGWVIVRAKRLDGPGPVAALGDAQVGALVIPPGAGPNDAGGWREQPSGTYVKAPGCCGFQVDGANFSNEIVVRAVL